MKNLMKFLGIAGLALVVPVLAQVPMPPTFSLSAEPEEVLRAYPLGVITEQAAFSHHGGPHREITLPNGDTGWLYNVGKNEWHRSYTLVFDGRRRVSDVLYYDHGKRGRGLSALLIQSRKYFSGAGRLGPPPNR